MEKYLCEECIACLPLKTKQICPACQKRETLDGSVCARCFGSTPLEGVFSGVPYHHKTVKKLIKTYKYSFAHSLAESLAKVLMRNIRRSQIPLPDIILPVPLHPRRHRYRGFNQAERLAACLAGGLLPNTIISYTTNTLIRAHYTAPQAQTDSRAERLKNLKHAFSVTNADTVREKRVWLVDDVATTNATLSQCARALKKSGAKEVWGIVLAS